MGKLTIINRALELPEDYFRDKQPEIVFVSEYQRGQALIVKGAKADYDVVDFWLAVLSWCTQGDDNLNQQLVYEQVVGPGSRRMHEHGNYLFRDKTDVLLEVYNDLWDQYPKMFHNYVKRLLIHAGDVKFSCLLEMDDTWNDHLLLAESEDHYFFFRWWTGE